MISGKEDLCCGCTTCEKICPTNAIMMQPDYKGFYSPQISNACISCGLCERYCPLRIEKLTVLNQKYIVAKRLNDELREKSQSGGAFSVFAEYVISIGGVVYGVALDKELKAVYQRVHHMKLLQSLRGSKYVQADVGVIYLQVKRDLQNNRTVLFSGTPCQVDGLNKYLACNKVNTKKLITMDLICHGVVSPMIYSDYLEFLKQRFRRKVRRFDFRSKRFGWHGDITKYSIGHRNYISSDYVNIFYSHLALRESCYNCQYTSLNRISDISIGDCWGIEKFNPNFDDNKGCSLLILNTEKGLEQFDLVKSEFEYFESEKEKILQPNLQHPTAKPKEYDMFWNDYGKYGFEYVSYKYCGIDPEKDYELIEKSEIIKRIRSKMAQYFSM